MVVINFIGHLGPKVENWRGDINKSSLKALIDEGINYDTGKVWVTFKANNFKGEGIYTSSDAQITRGRLILTTTRLVAVVSGHKLVDIPMDHPWFKEMEMDFSDPKRFTIKLDLTKFPTGFEGLVSISYHIKPENLSEWI